MIAEQDCRNYICSIVITVHAEGRLLHRTMRALERSIIYAKEVNGYPCEVIIVKDKVVDQTTTDVVDFWQKRIGAILSIYEVEFGALSLSRNFGVSKSIGKYISILDGDDLYCEKWISRAVGTLENGVGDIAHPAYILGFPFDPFIKKLNNEDHRNVVRLFEENLWPALLMAPSKIFDEIQYIEDRGQYAYQDWLWNCDTIEKGYRHICVDQTVMAIRQKAPGKSLWQKSFRLNKIVRPNNLFYRLIKESSGYISHGKKRFGIGSLIDSLLEHINYKSPYIYDSLKMIKRKIFKTGLKKIENWVRDDLEKLERIEPELSLLKEYRTVHDTGKVALLSVIPKKISCLLDLNSVDIFFLGTENDFDFNAYRFDSDNRFAIISEIAGQQGIKLEFDWVLLQDIKISEEKLAYLVLRVLLQTKINRLIISNSEFAVNLFLKYRNVISSNEKIASITTPVGFEDDQKINDPYIIKIIDFIDYFNIILVDTPLLATALIELYCIPEEKVKINFISRFD